MTQRTVERNDPRIVRLLDKVRRMARAIARSVPPSVQLDDLIAAGYLGVATALSRYTGDPEAFEHFAIVHARGAILDELRRLDPMSRSERLKARRAHTVSQKLSTQLGRRADEAEIAAEMGIGLPAYREIMTRRPMSQVDSLDEEGVGGQELPADEQIDSRRERSRMSAELASLSGRHATVIELSFVRGETLQSIARTLGISVARAHQIRGDALQKLRRACQSTEGPHRDAAA